MHVDIGRERVGSGALVRFIMGSGDCGAARGMYKGRGTTHERDESGRPRIRGGLEWGCVWSVQRGACICTLYKY